MKLYKLLFILVLVVATIIPPKMIFAEVGLMIKVDLWENKLTVKEGEKTIKSFSIATGKDDTPTPVGYFTVIEKSKDWGGGFGSRWLGLNVPWGIYGIHGTNKPNLIGRNVSSGCVRMKNKDAEDLYEQIPVGTPVIIEGPIHGLDNHIDVLVVGSKGTLVYLVQQRLRLAGYYKGKVDGVFDNKTQKAIEKYQEDHNLIVTGNGNERLYMKLGLLE
ncbi:L,D-transpeptidase family protein [Schinkia azotoformans]|uniref:ErfK/YbiS/YcfS/YnhG family protein n=1 Tax=Schinkia azotoformans LMG 9581 TaxID=1131731 RepID=K6E245_SCHAZ|nr:L,D-transpeptidase family protein [Schinkia azotoformans]EKN67256.1 ErfK/YbiS/YcfS/YnhG family protein [Schinkia azotoformans LMG 9581]MEC1639905.1 L,D-transpeptidase family protein [Schinkia azotoformans]MEC1722912.1 L,D-transpeptidase family protein [Schinkia azotoformans]MEC1947126.1 L,D-transpeptidase family protein [Schinkia azotoformans]MED4352853.1 L,D-transpeptidase family protein [Schinkia azotoformans]